HADETVLAAHVGHSAELASRREIDRRDDDAGEHGFGFVGDGADDSGFDLRARRRRRREEDEQGGENTGTNAFHRFLLRSNRTNWWRVRCRREQPKGLRYVRSRFRSRPRTIASVNIDATTSAALSSRACKDEERAPVARRRMSSYFASAC